MLKFNTKTHCLLPQMQSCNNAIKLVNKHNQSNFYSAMLNNALNRHQNYSIVRFIHSLNSNLRLLIKALFALQRYRALLFTLVTFTSVQIAHAETNSIDAELNRVYQQVIKNDDIRYIAALKNAQKSWLKYRDLQCTLEADTYHVYNDNQAKNFDICINTFNQARLYFLKNQLDKLEGI